MNKEDKIMLNAKERKRLRKMYGQDVWRIRINQDLWSTYKTLIMYQF
jgi:hypothetical protein